MLKPVALNMGRGSWLSRWWRAYEKNLRRRPILTQSLMTSVLWGIGDLFAQEIEGHRADPLRAAVTAAYGATLVGPTGHVWYLWLDRFAAKHFLPGSSSFILAKILADGLAFGPVHVGTYFAFMTLLEGGSLQDVATKLKKDFMSSYLTELVIWPPIQLFNFRYVPVKHQLMVVNIASVLDSGFLSWVGHQENWVEAVMQNLGLGRPTRKAGMAESAALE